VKSWKNTYPSAEAKEWIHPAAMRDLLYSPEGLQKLKQELDSKLPHELDLEDDSDEPLIP
jgi:hypothetical protein